MITDNSGKVCYSRFGDQSNWSICEDSGETILRYVKMVEINKPEVIIGNTLMQSSRKEHREDPESTRSTPKINYHAVTESKSTVEHIFQMPIVSFSRHDSLEEALR